MGIKNRSKAMRFHIRPLSTSNNKSDPVGHSWSWTLAIKPKPHTSEFTSDKLTNITIANIQIAVKLDIIFVVARILINISVNTIIIYKEQKKSVSNTYK